MVLPSSTASASGCDKAAPAVADAGTEAGTRRQLPRPKPVASTRCSETGATEARTAAEENLSQ